PVSGARALLPAEASHNRATGDRAADGGEPTGIIKGILVMSGETYGPLRVALAGCGRIAERVYLSALRRLPQVSLVAAIEPSEDRRHAVAALIGDAQLYESIEACLASVPVDAVIVATPSTSHLSIATTAVRARLAVLIEKPLAPGLEGVSDFE